MRQTGKGDEQFGIGCLTKILDADIPCLLIQHISGIDAFLGYVASGHCDAQWLFFSKSLDAQFYFGILRTLQFFHCHLVGQLFAYKRGVVHADNLVARNHTSALGGSVSYHVLHPQCVVVDDKFHADARERTFQAIILFLYVSSGYVGRVGVQFCQ